MLKENNGVHTLFQIIDDDNVGLLHLKGQQNCFIQKLKVPIIDNGMNIDVDKDKYIQKFTVFRSIKIYLHFYI